MNITIDTSNFILFLSFLTIGITLISISIYYRSKAIRTKDWTFTIGKIIGSDVIKEDILNDGEVTFKPKILYAYRLNDKEYTSDRITIFFKYSSNTSYAKRLIKKYPKDSQVKIYYDPYKPEHSILEPGIPNEVGILLFIGLIFISISVILICSLF